MASRKRLLESHWEAIVAAALLALLLHVMGYLPM
jgi:hypothetical protein